MKRFLVILASLLLASTISSAKVTLSGVVGDNMVLQRNTSVKLWGKSDSGKPVRIKTSWNKAKYSVKPNEDGTWCVKVKTGEAGGPYTIEINDGDKLTLSNILLGEVWICSGQSNMEIPVKGYIRQGIEESREAILNASTETPNIRMFTVPQTASDTLQTECGGEWKTATAANVANFSATAYFFAKALTKYLGKDIPIGLISPNWGGSNIESWMTRECIDNIQGIDTALAKSRYWNNGQPQRLYNTMIYPIHNLTAKGFIWYQGESNRFNWFDYNKILAAMVNLWRQIWEDEKMPFYLVQLAPYKYDDANHRSLPLMIEQQWEAADNLQYSGIASTTDIGNRDCIHPSQKREVGERLAYLALANDYGFEGMPTVPRYKSMSIEDRPEGGKSILVHFSGVMGDDDWENPSCFRSYNTDGETQPQGFEIAGADGVWHKAEAAFQEWRNSIYVWSDEVPDPVAVRYAFKNYCPEANLVTNLGQPLPPFRTDRWKVDDIGSTE